MYSFGLSGLVQTNYAKSFKAVLSIQLDVNGLLQICFICGVLCHAQSTGDIAPSGLLKSICSRQTRLSVALAKLYALRYFTNARHKVISCLHLVTPSFLLILLFRSDNMS